MAGFLAELKSDLQSKTPYIIWVICSGVFATTGPFGTYTTVSLLGRLVYWLPVLAICVGLATVVRAFVCGGLGLKDSVFGFVLTTVLICLVLCPPFYLAARLVFLDRRTSTPGLTEIILLVGSISMGMILLRQSVQPVAGDDSPAPKGDATSLLHELRLLRRLGSDLQGDLWSITVNNHHVEVVTSAGSASLLMRLGDAILEAEPIEGDQVHRSHWVAWAAVEGADRDGARLFLRMKGGQRIPVSRANRAKVEERLGLAPSAEAVVSSAA
ncbi:LytTR family DNA-binding domain-containing protein [Fuscibacter oryzae]|uniref:LytTR family transcriptional regulator n=1 Tax=Fuscibacter oryzae TaxID=2803939 RepID=A0A8J7MNS2_9RHOB|nr:LytTR family DNA-binding domain-containing protein [Fuscibacter oryzae]MBL4927206.1 LytTR family transcriptional regulator [Fuscibacter oryzae]